jgi:hypothetical protein
LRPSVYLDQWVWVRLAAAATGRPQDAIHADLLEAVSEASDAGVAFPLSSTHYIETTRIRNVRQRRDLAEVMGRISHCRTLRSRKDLLLDQLLLAMHETFGRPMFRPRPEDALGIGVHWAFVGKQHALRIFDSATNEGVESAVLPTDVLCRLNQWGEMQLIGARGEDEAAAHTTEIEKSRLAWERDFSELLEHEPASRSELRLYVLAREVAHEHLDLVIKTLDEYGIPLGRLLGTGRSVPAQREFIMRFFDRMPSVRATVDVKVGTFYDNMRAWQVSDVYDADALAIAVPYCHAVVADKAKADGMRRARTSEWSGTAIISDLEELMASLGDLAAEARALPDPSGWDWLSPGAGFHPISPDDYVRSVA